MDFQTCDPIIAAIHSSVESSIDLPAMPNTNNNNNAEQGDDILVPDLTGLAGKARSMSKHNYDKFFVFSHGATGGPRGGWTSVPFRTVTVDDCAVQQDVIPGNTCF